MLGGSTPPVSPGCIRFSTYSLRRLLNPLPPSTSGHRPPLLAGPGSTTWHVAGYPFDSIVKPGQREAVPGSFPVYPPFSLDGRGRPRPSFQDRPSVQEGERPQTSPGVPRLWSNPYLDPSLCVGPLPWPDVGFGFSGAVDLTTALSLTPPG